MNIIEVKNVSKNYKTYQRGSEFKDTFYSIFMRRKITVNAIKDLSFNIPQGQIVGIIGPNGAGKSTLIKMLTGVLVPTSGEIHSMGFIPCKQRSKYTFNIGVVFGQKSQLIWDIPPQDAFYMNKAIYNIDTKQFNSNLNEFIELLDVSEVIKKPTRKLSLGERMKCEFIMAMLHNPEIVFLDEPTIGLDIIAQSKIHEVIQKLNKKGVTFILTTHNLEDIEKLAQRVMVINQGELVFDNNIESLRNHLGTKKRIRIISNNKLAILEQEGVKIINTDKDYENLIELDNNIINTMKFISEFVGNENISDISIEEPPIDEVIRVLYSKQKER